ncbi:hypothetical protein TcasGA2_TC001446 [Tribolium castaneum]|uniref:Uncharacterized protein n=1 Tax=Tribolium castaneum TaxID=7070 RepID=D7EIJ3_TRICA|nr:hypothetical protein TcasGA2_TC001446 [Tribolium castaneum]
MSMLGSRYREEALCWTER